MAHALSKKDLWEKMDKPILEKYLRKMFNNFIVDKYRLLGIERLFMSIEDLKIEPFVDSDEYRIIDRCDRKKITGRFKELTENQKRALLAVMESNNYSEASEKLGITREAVKQRMKRNRKKIKKSDTI